MPPAAFRPRVVCGRKGCSGSCPSSVVEAGFQPGKQRAQCWTCGQDYPRPNVSFGDYLSVAKKGASKGSGNSKGGTKERQLASDNEKLRAENERLKDKLPEKATTQVGDEEDTDDLDKEIAKLQKHVAALRDFEPDSDHTKDVEAKLEAARARRASAKPLETRQMQLARRLK